MRLLLDTHVVLWAARDELTGQAAEVVPSANVAAVSAVSIWEIEIKRALGSLRAPDDVAERADAAGFEQLFIGFDHAKEAGRLPLHHRDPFDRMLVAQARVEGLTLATADEELARYDVPILAITPPGA